VAAAANQFLDPLFHKTYNLGVRVNPSLIGNNVNKINKLGFMPQSLPVNSQDLGKTGDRRSSASRTFFARAILVLAFPFWFPRLFFWLVVEFVRYHFTDWVPKRDAALGDRLETIPLGRPHLSLLKGEGLARGPHANGLESMTGPQPTRLTLIKSDRKAS